MCGCPVGCGLRAAVPNLCETESPTGLMWRDAMSSFGWRRRGGSRDGDKSEATRACLASGISQWKTKPRRFGSYPNTTSNIAVFMLLTTEQVGRDGSPSMRCDDALLSKHLHIIVTILRLQQLMIWVCDR